MNDWHEAEQRVERAHQLAESRRWAEALTELDAAIAINPDMGNWQAQRGFLLDQLERFDEAIGAYRASISIDPGDVEVMLALGIDLTRMNQCEDAVDILADAARLAPDMEPSYCYRILALSELGRHDEAEQMFYTAQQITEECPHCFYHIGASLAARSDFSKAIYCWSRTLDIDATYPGVKQAIAQAYREQGNLERAREYYLAEIRQDPGNIDLLFDMAELELEAGHPVKATAKLRQIVELDPEYAHAHFALGEVLLELEEPNESLEALRSAAELDPGLPRLHLRLGQALMQRSDFRDAVRHLSAALEESSDDETALLAWGNCLLRLGRIGDASEKFEQLLSINSKCSDAFHNLGVCCFLRGDHDAGLKHVLQAIEVNPRDLVAMHKAVLVLLHVRRWSEARTMIDRALDLDPNDAALRDLRNRFWRVRLRSTLRQISAFFQRIVAGSRRRGRQLATAPKRLIGR